MRAFCMESGEKNGSAAVRALLRFAFWEIYGAAPPELRKQPSGKPFFPDLPNVHLSLSHTDGAVLCALSASPVGADIQAPRAVSARLPERVCAPEELEQFSFFELWTLKESYIKLNGGLTAELRQIKFRRSAGGIITPDPSVCARLYPRVYGCYAAVCGEEPALPNCIELVSPGKVFGGY